MQIGHIGLADPLVVVGVGVVFVTAAKVTKINSMTWIDDDDDC